MLITDFRPFPFLSTARLNLRRITDEDIEQVFFLRSDPGLLEFLDRDPARSKDEAVAWQKMIDAGIENNQFITWGISLQGKPGLVGTIAFWNITKEHFRAEIGYVLVQEYQGMGLMQEAFEKVIDFGFKTIGLHSIEANVNPNNNRSIRLLEKNGFIKEAHFRENWFYNGKFIDSAIYSRLNPYHESSFD